MTLKERARLELKRLPVDEALEVIRRSDNLLLSSDIKSTRKTRRHWPLFTGMLIADFSSTLPSNNRPLEQRLRVGTQEGKVPFFSVGDYIVPVRASLRVRNNGKFFIHAAYPVPEDTQASEKTAQTFMEGLAWRVLNSYTGQAHFGENAEEIAALAYERGIAKKGRLIDILNSGLPHGLSLSRGTTTMEYMHEVQQLNVHSAPLKGGNMTITLTNRVLFVSVSAVGSTLPVESLAGAVINEISRGSGNLELLRRS